MMQKRYLGILLTLLFSIPVSGQQAERSVSIDDLDFVYEQLTKTASYRTQAKNRIKAEAKYQELKRLYTSTDLSIIEHYIKLYELVDQVKDYHNDIYGNTESFSYENLKDPQFLAGIRNSPEYNFYPGTGMDLDSLEKALARKPIDDYEGIYHYSEYFKIAIRKREDNMLEGIVLETLIPSWQRGETILYLLPVEGNRFRLITGRFIDKKLVSGIDYFYDGEFKTNKWRKEKDKTGFYDADFPGKKFHIEELQEGITYIRLGSFSSSDEGIREATAFFNRIADSLNSKNLVIDLRNNSGGGDKSSGQFYRLLKKYKGHIYVLVNFYTVSNAEQLAIKLKKLSNVTLLGDDTRGMITYGRNYSEDKEVPSKMFRVYFSDLKDHWRRYLQYEGRGIRPDVYLAPDRSWLDQTVEKIKQPVSRKQ